MPPVRAPLSCEVVSRGIGAARSKALGHLVPWGDAAAAPLGDCFPMRLVGDREQPARGALPTDTAYPSKTFRGSEILQPVRKTIRAGNPANGSQLLSFHSLGSCNVIVSPCSLVASEISKPDNT